MESDEPQLLPYSIPQHSNSFKRLRRSLQGNTPLSSVSESVSPSQLTSEVIEHINALKHLKDDQIFCLLESARNGDRMRLSGLSGLSGPDRSSMSTLGSRSSAYLSVPSSRVTSTFSDPRSSIASTDSSFTNYSAVSNRHSTASSRLSTTSTNTSPKNFACTFCDKALKSKPYWKSHEEEFHEQRLTWRCPDCEQIFHAGKRFREHHTKLHGCENCKQPRESGQPTSRKPSPCVKKYEIVMHDKDAWGCGFCASLLTTWEERCEHIALHFEEKRSKWNFTNVILALLKQTDVSQVWTQLLQKQYGDQQNWPRFTWESKRCNRLRYKLETKWDTRAFDVGAIVRETSELAEVETAEPEERVEPVEHTELTETVDCKLESFDFPPVPNSQGMAAENTMMDLDPVESLQSVSQPAIQQTQQWPINTNMSHNTMNDDVDMGAYNGFTANMNPLPTDFTQQQTVPQSYHHQQSWSDAGFSSTPDIVNYQQQGNYMHYAPEKQVVQVPTSQYSNFVRPASQHSQHSSQQQHHNFARPSSQHTSQYPQANFSQFPRQSVPADFLHQHSNSASSRRFIPRLINIASSSPRGQQQQGDQPPPPPPKDDNRFSRMSMRRRPSNISQHTVVSQRDVGWNDEVQWG